MFFLPLYSIWWYQIDKKRLCISINDRFFDFYNNSNLLYEFYKTPFCRTRFLEHEERSDDTIFFLFCPLNLKKVQSIMLGKLYLVNIRVGNAGK
jgi:hypothetical protein